MRGIIDSFDYLFTILTWQKSLLFLLLSAGPTLLWLLVCLRFDRSAPEPKIQIFKTFVFGAVLTIPIIFAAGYLIGFFEGSFHLSDLARIFVLSFLIDGLIEESAKYVILRWRVYKSTYFDELRDGFIYGMVLGLGLAFVENFLYGLIGSSLADSATTILLRGFTTTFLHFLCGGIIGYYLGLVKFRARRFSVALEGLLLAILFHGLYNTVIRFDWWWNIFPLIILLIGVYRVILKKIKSFS